MKNLKILSIIVTAFFQLNAVAQKAEKENAVFSTKFIDKVVLVQYSFANTKRQTQNGPLNVILYRGGEKNENVKPIYQYNNLPANSDFYYEDPAPRSEGIYMYTIEIISNNEVVSREISKAFVFPPDKKAAITVFTVKPKQNTDEVSLNWKLMNGMLAGDINIMRSRKMNEGYTLLATVRSTETNYTDHVYDANEPFFYKLQVADIRNGEAVYSPSMLAIADFEIKPDVVQNVRAGLQNGKPVVAWQSIDPKSRGFYIYKRTRNTDKFTQASELIVNNDRNFYKWTDNEVGKRDDYYQYMVMAESNSYTKSDPSDTVMIELPAEAVAPAIPQDLHFVMQNNVPVQLIWAVDSMKVQSITGYTVYQKKKGERSFSILKDDIAADQNSVDLERTESESSFIVKAKAGDQQSDESEPLLFIAKATADFGPQYLKAEIIDGAVNISWQNTGDDVREYRLYKLNGRNYTLDQKVNGDVYTVVARNYTAGEKNQYILKAVNAAGEENAGTKVIVVF